MNLALIITDLQIGGTPTVVRELAMRLPASVISLAPDGPVSEQLRAAGRPVYSLELSSSIALPLAIGRLARLIRQEKFDTVLSFLIHANTVAAGASRFCRGTRFLQSIQTTQPTPRWHWKLQSLVHHAAENIVVPSPSVVEAAMKWSSIPREKFVVIPNAVDVSSFSRLTSDGNGPQAGRLNEEKRRIGFIGRLDPIKRIDDLIEAMVMLPDHRLEIFGEGSERPRLEKLIIQRRFNDRVILHGAIADPKDALDQIDILVLPSSAEGFGLVLIEAMAAGVPVVATNVPGIRDVVRDNETGLLVPVNAPLAIAEAVKRLADSTLRERLVANAMNDVSARYSWSTILPRYRALLGEGVGLRPDR